MQHSTRERIAWFRWRSAYGASVAETCRYFGIARATFYYWHQRLDPVRPAQTLRRKPRRKTARVAPKAALFFLAVIKLKVAHPRWGRRRIRTALRALRDDAPAEATIGRWLQDINAKCPICKGSQGHHNEGSHYLYDDFADIELAPRVQPRRTKPTLTAKNALTEVEPMFRQDPKTDS